MNYRKALSYVPLVFFLCLLIVVGGLLWRAYQGDASYQLVSSLSTFALVAITIFYAWQLRKNAENTAKTLDEMQKDRAKHGKILTIAYGIDPICEELDSYYEEWTRPDEGYYPELKQRWQIPDDAFISDIEEQYPEFSEDFKEFTSIVNRYESEWVDLHEHLQCFLLEEADEPLEVFSIYKDGPHERESKKNTQRMASYALNPDGHHGIDDMLIGNTREKVWEEIKDEVVSLREETEFEDEFKVLQKHFEKLKGKNQFISRELKEARDNLKTEYGITDLEIEEVKKESPLEDPDIIIFPIT